MNLIKKALGIGAGYLILTLSGCGDNYSPVDHFTTSVDLNGDKKQEIVVLKPGACSYKKNHLNHLDYDLVTNLSRSDGSYGGPKLLYRIQSGHLDHIELADFDGDGDLDLIFSEYGKEHWRTVDYDTFVVKNDGKGNFGKAKLVSRQQK